jgi:hypothetical protein
VSGEVRYKPGMNVAPTCLLCLSLYACVPQKPLPTAQSTEQSGFMACRDGPAELRKIDEFQRTGRDFVIRDRTGKKSKVEIELQEWIVECSHQLRSMEREASLAQDSNTQRRLSATAAAWRQNLNYMKSWLAAYRTY